MLFDFANKVVLITGAGRGLGKHMALAFARTGADLVIAARNQRELEEVAEEVKATGQKVIISCTDVSQYASVEAMIQNVKDHFGRLDILVNNAGVVIAKPLFALSEKDLDYMFDVNVKGVAFTTKFASELMMERRQGKIINISSFAGKVGYAMLSAYSASKFAVIGFTQSIANELAAYNIQVNAVCPGLMETGFSEEVFEDMSRYSALSADEVKSSFIARIPAGRSASLGEVCNTVMFLASEVSGYITGEAITLSGGLLTI